MAIKKHEPIQVEGTVIYCDACSKCGPQAAYDDVESVSEEAERQGWELGDRDLCQECKANQTKAKAKAEDGT